jgi:hypothetical protein
LQRATISSMALSWNPGLIEKPPNIPRMTTAPASTGFCGLCGKISLATRSRRKRKSAALAYRKLLVTAV